MIFRRFSPLGAALLSITVVGLSLLGLTGTGVSHLPFTSEVVTHSLTGLSGEDGAVLVVKIDDTPAAHPQVGLREADVVYIEQVEGGLTRLAAVYSSQIPTLVGPVRSARISDIDLFAQFGRVAFAYSGAQTKFRPVLAAANLSDVGAMKYGAAFYANDPLRVPPYAMMLKAQGLLNHVQTSGVQVAVSKRMGWSFGAAPSSMEKFSSVHISWPTNSYDAQWSKSEGRWLLSHNGSPDFDETGYQLGPKTLVIQIVSITDSIYHDKVGGVTPYSATVGSGDCFILRNGAMVKAHWSRNDIESGTTFTGADGQEIAFDRGQIWFALTSKAPIFTGLSLQDATNPPSK